MNEIKIKRIKKCFTPSPSSPKDVVCLPEDEMEVSRDICTKNLYSSSSSSSSISSSRTYWPWIKWYNFYNF